MLVKVPKELDISLFTNNKESTIRLSNVMINYIGDLLQIKILKLDVSFQAIISWSKMNF